MKFPFLTSFIVFLFIINSGGTDKNVSELAGPVLEIMDLTDVTEKSPAEAAKVFGYDRSNEDGAVYYSSDNVMNVSELLIVKLKDSSYASDIREAVEKRVEEQKNLYRNYAPEQYSLLEKCIIRVSGNTVFYCTAENADEIYESFKKAM
jgi:hypothetical protein